MWLPKSKLGKFSLGLVIVLVLLAAVGAYSLRYIIVHGVGVPTARSPCDKVGATTKRGMVVGTSGALAQEAGVEMLTQGGSAADAALATALLQITLAGGSWVSFAGIMNMVYYDAQTEQVYNMNAAYNTVQNENDPASIPGSIISSLGGGFTRPHFSGRTVLVPGFMAGVEAAHQRFGKLPFATIFEPAIRVAEGGFELSEALAGQIRFRKNVLSRFPEMRRIFTNGENQFYEVGDLFKQMELAATLREVGKQGASYMYTGEWAEKFILALQAIGGKMTLEDLTDYQVLWSEPLMTTYRDYEIYAHGLPADGGVNLLEAMNLLEVSDLASHGHYTDSPDTLYWLSQIMRNDALSEIRLSDEPIQTAIDISPESRVSKPHARELWELMKRTREFFGPSSITIPRHSDSVVVVDEAGNVAAMEHSINTVIWGQTGLMVDGVSVNDSASFQQAAIEHTGPGKRLPDLTNPGIVVKDGKPFLGFSSIGFGLHQRTVSTLFSVLGFGMSPQEAINQPSIGRPIAFPGWLGVLLGTHQTVGMDEFEPDVLKLASRNGLDFVGNNMMAGYWVGILIDPEMGIRHGGRTCRFDGRAVGY